jgi:hypothetical protein
MSMDEKTRHLLIKKLQFSPQHVSRLEKDKDLLSKTLGLLQLIKKSPKNKDVKSSVLSQLKKIRQTLSKPRFAASNVLLKAREEYYTFQKAARWSILSRGRRLGVDHQ